MNSINIHAYGVNTVLRVDQSPNLRDIHIHTRKPKYTLQFHSCYYATAQPPNCMYCIYIRVYVLNIYCNVCMEGVWSMVLVRFWFNTVHPEKQGVIFQMLTIYAVMVAEILMGDEGRLSMAITSPSSFCDTPTYSFGDITIL